MNGRCEGRKTTPTLPVSMGQSDILNADFYQAENGTAKPATPVTVTFVRQDKGL